MFKNLTIFVILLLNCSVFAQQPSWFFKLKQLRPLQSTEKDVEKMFGKPTERSITDVTYKTKDGVLEVIYSEGKCNEGNTHLGDNYDVGKGTVIYLDFELEEMILFESLGININGFDKEESSDTPNFVYKNKILGISYGTFRQGWDGPEKLTYISIFPAKKHSHLICSADNKQK